MNSSIKSLPNELLSEVIARVASSSFSDYINAFRFILLLQLLHCILLIDIYFNIKDLLRVSCKIFNGVSNDRYVTKDVHGREKINFLCS